MVPFSPFPEEPEKSGELEEPQEDLDYLAVKTADLHPKSLGLLFLLLAGELKSHAQKDHLRGRPMRSLALRSASEYLRTAEKCFSPISSSVQEISSRDIEYRSYLLSRLRYGELADFFVNVAGCLENQKQYVVCGYLKEAQSRLTVAEILSP